ncbi:hypothetical protein HA402_013337 [Bradysia odoriphaga]|nr:hypothetical protein HA402_013337 [Bradysia odoriphaga]
MDQAQQGVQCGYGLSIAEIKRLDPHAKAILYHAHNVAIFTCSPEMNDWSETFTQASVLVYNRNCEPKHALFTLDRTSSSQEITNLTPQKEFHFEAPFLFCKDLGRVRCFRFEAEDVYNRISKLIRRLMESIRFRLQLSRPNYTEVLSMLAESQGVSDHSTEQSNQVNEAMPSLARTTPLNVWTIFDDENEPMQHARIEGNERVRSNESVTPEPPLNFHPSNPATSHSVSIFPFSSRTTATSPYVIDTVNATMKHPLNQVNETLPDVSRIFGSSNPAARQINPPIPSLSRTKPTSSNVPNIFNLDNAAKKHSIYQLNKPTSSSAPARSVLPPSSHIFCDTNTRTRQTNKAVPSLLRTALASSKAMSTTDAVNAAMAHDLYQVDKSSPSYSITTPESTTAMSMSNGANVPKKRMLPAPWRVDQIEKRQKIAASFQCSQMSSDTISQASSSSHHHHLPPQMMPSTSTRRAEDAEVSAMESHPNATTIRPKPKLYSPLMFMDRKPLPNETNTSTPTETMGVIRLNKLENLTSNRHNPTTPSPLVSMERKESTKETGNSTVGTGTEQLSSGVFRVNSSERHGNGSPEPLTQNQLLQAISYLIRTDTGFVHKLHQAYLQSFCEMLSKTN